MNVISALALLPKDSHDYLKDTNIRSLFSLETGKLYDLGYFSTDKNSMNTVECRVVKQAQEHPVGPQT